jgi:ABC-type nitrate/sulfonate/bicarbonate transport system permease component
MKIRKILLSKTSVKLYVLAIILTAWQAVGQSVNPIIWTTPALTAITFEQLWLDGTLPGELQITLYTILIGFAAAAVVGIPMGLMMGRTKFVEYGLDPYINLLYSIPIVVILPMLGIWFGSNLRSSLLATFLGAFFPIVINTLVGVKNVPRDMLETGRSFGFAGLKLWRTVVLPSTVPYIMAGLRIGMGIAIAGAILSEMFLYAVGLGEALIYYAATFDTAGIISGIFLTMILGIVLTESIKFAEHRISGWAKGSAGLR